VVEADAVERVEKGKTTLDLVRFDHALEDVFDGDMLALACKVVGDGKNGPEIVGRVAPLHDVIQFEDVARVGAGWQRQHTFCSEEAIIKVKPSDNCADVESSANRIELIIGPRDLSS
jgi:hypothetical protein